MAHTERRKAYGRCPEQNCDYCVDGTAKRPARRKARREAKIELRRELQDA